MGFTPRKSVVLRNDDGAEIVAHPFFYTDQSESGIKVELITDEGKRLLCVDEQKGVYSLGDPGKLLYLRPSLNGNRSPI